MSGTIHQNSTDFIRVATLEEVKAKGCIVVHGTDRPIAVFYHDGKVYAVDNRCPHMGFPLQRGTVTDGILTCHWHHARFDLSSGCTFDLFAGDVLTSPVEIRDGEVWIGSGLHVPDLMLRSSRQLQEGMAQDISLTTAKAVIALLKNGAPARDIVRDGALFGAHYRDGWASGMTILTTMANLMPYLPEEQKFLALYQGLCHVAEDCAGQAPRHAQRPLEGTGASFNTLKRWFRYWTLVRHRDAAERTILTAISNGASPAEVADIMFTAATDRYYPGGGHALDSINKAFEILAVIGWEHAGTILPVTVRQLVGARGGEELNSWRHPIDLVLLLGGAFEQLATWFKAGTGGTWSGEVQLAQHILSDDPRRIVEALGDAICHGAKLQQLGKALCYAAALRIAHFGTANEFGDWITALHTFTYCNALHQGIKRMPSSRLDENNYHEIVRGIFHGAMSVYLDRFLNVPPARLPGERDYLDDEPADPEELCARFLEVLDTQQRVDEGARVVARYFSQGHPVERLIATLAHGVLREDAEFHTFQMLEAAVQQYNEWGYTPEGGHILIALARYLAAHSPTQRTQLQTAEIALRLHRGETLYKATRS